MTEYSGWWKCLRKLSTLNYRPGDPGWIDMQAWLLWHPWNRSGSIAWIKSLHKKKLHKKVMSFAAALIWKIYALFNTVCFDYTHYPPQKNNAWARHTHWWTHISTATTSLPFHHTSLHCCLHQSFPAPPSKRTLTYSFSRPWWNSYGWDTKRFGVWEGQTCMLQYSHQKSSSFGQ